MLGAFRLGAQGVSPPGAIRAPGGYRDAEVMIYIRNGYSPVAGLSPMISYYAIIESISHGGPRDSPAPVHVAVSF